eukprot:TRINITY_DN52737_c0_g1_i1.p1 TRINITY_DN52737_c0_g1~~TRINITY_DN52737_c0_g1_i1.p1  ORF type:complete len:615 (-),score=67.60 TRINITY_DN52737_c0_g1_i1:223-2067(-)
MDAETKLWDSEEDGIVREKGGEPTMAEMKENPQLARRRIQTIVHNCRATPADMIKRQIVGYNSTDDQLMQHLTYQSSPRTALFKAGLAKADAHVVARLLPIALKALPEKKQKTDGPSINGKQVFWFSLCCFIIIPALSFLPLIFESMGQDGWFGGTCELVAWADDECNNEGCRFVVAITPNTRSHGRSLYLNSWEPPRQIAYHLEGVIYTGNALRCCSRGGNVRKCCDMKDPIRGTFCDQWKSRYDDEGEVCPHGAWGCRYTYDGARVLVLEEYEALSFWWYLLAGLGGSLMLLGCCAGTVDISMRLAAANRERLDEIRANKAKTAPTEVTVVDWPTSSEEDEPQVTPSKDAGKDGDSPNSQSAKSLEASTSPTASPAEEAAAFTVIGGGGGGSGGSAGRRSSSRISRRRSRSESPISSRIPVDDSPDTVKTARSSSRISQSALPGQVEDESDMMSMTYLFSGRKSMRKSKSVRLNETVHETDDEKRIRAMMSFEPLAAPGSPAGSPPTIGPAGHLSPSSRSTGYGRSPSKAARPSNAGGGARASKRSASRSGTLSGDDLPMKQGSSPASPSSQQSPKRRGKTLRDASDMRASVESMQHSAPARRSMRSHTSTF